jgi:hypothetical protein
MRVGVALGHGGGLPSVGSCSYRPDTKEAKFKKGTTTYGTATENSGLVGFFIKKTHGN